MNPLLHTDVYKMGHMEQYPEGTTKIYSYLTTRSDVKFNKVILYGLQYYLKKFFAHKIEKGHVEEFLALRKEVLSMELPKPLSDKLYRLATLPYIPLKVKALPEGSKVGKMNCLLTMTNTHPDFAFLVGLFESLLLKVWYSSTVATNSYRYYRLATRFATVTCDDDNHLPFAVHDFGYRGVSSEETAEIGGSAHLLSFLGTDTVIAIPFAKKYYHAGGPVGLSVPATEHCVMCVHGKDHEFEAFERMLDIYPEHAIISIVSDTYNLWHVLTDFVPRLKDRILARSGKVVFRPDSGDPISIVCGDESKVVKGNTSPEAAGALQLLDNIFGHTANEKGYKVLNPKVGLIYGDGMFYDRYQSMLDRLARMGWASSNIVIGVGGLLLQQHSRDDLAFAFKATYCEVDGQPREIYKNPITDASKKSHKGFMKVEQYGENFVTKDQVDSFDETQGELLTVFNNGQFFNESTFQEIRERVKS